MIRKEILQRIVTAGMYWWLLCSTTTCHIERVMMNINSTGYGMHLTQSINFFHSALTYYFISKPLGFPGWHVLLGFSDKFHPVIAINVEVGHSWSLMNDKFNLLILVKYLKKIMYTKRNHLKTTVKTDGLIHVVASIKVTVKVLRWRQHSVPYFFDNWLFSMPVFCNILLVSSSFYARSTQALGCVTLNPHIRVATNIDIRLSNVGKASTSSR
jgi:hypothetical protein